MGLNPAISPAYSGLPVLDGLPSGMALHVGCPLRGGRVRTSVPSKTIKEKKKRCGIIEPPTFLEPPRQLEIILTVLNA
jgi:hypothetical protein